MQNYQRNKKMFERSPQRIVDPALTNVTVFGSLATALVQFKKEKIQCLVTLRTA